MINIRWEVRLTPAAVRLLLTLYLPLQCGVEHFSATKPIWEANIDGVV